ncbi:nucleotidyltransferase family protein [Rhodovulum marinum]|uniref:MurNAc alpha-1-phosphate uridylyltransferase n=1 Tax=Rhodovulum marinum TaxID=320662 RepID=A0A4R2Q0Z9_9RHOB|nr:nucleotidyltransferase family protein [Rhodovulum marinum]TCP40305.1 MurNAc alpha-1-phosphate uridylyltransferase [Rhodovulum marinum]
MQPDALMLFAAGFGTRMGALTADRPKPLIDVAGRPLIDHALGLAGGAGIARIVVNTHYLAEQVAAHLAGRAGVTLSHEAERILDTGGGLRHALPLLGADTVFTLNSDAVWTGPNPLDRLAAAWDPERMDGLMLLVPAARARGHRGAGDFTMDDAGRLTRGGTGVYTGAQILKTGNLGPVDASVFSLNRVWDRMLAEGRLFGLLHMGGWCDVGHPAGIAEAEAMLMEARDD